MRSLLIHNPKAGYGQVDAAELLAMLAKAGHGVTYQSSDVDDLGEVLGQRWDLVIAAGGDGTATRIAKLCAGSPTPLAILPLGTANNFARGVGHYGALEDLITAWDLRSVQPIDLGAVTGEWGASRFAECCGMGLLAAGIIAHHRGDAEKARSRHRNAAEQLAAAVQVVRECLQRLEPVEATVRTESGVSTQKLLWAEAALVNSVGPRLGLFDSHVPGDGTVSYALLPEEERRTFDQLLKDRLEGRVPQRTGLIIGRTTSLTLSWRGAPAHADGRLLPAFPGEPSQQRLEMTVRPKAVQLLRLEPGG